MPDAYGWDIREQAEELYIIDGLTYEQVAERTGVSLTQLKRWGTDSEPGWAERRREYRQAQTTVRRGVMLAKAKAVNSLLEAMDPQTAYAFSSLVSAGRVIEEESRRQRIEDQGQAEAEVRQINTAEDAVAALGEAVQRKVNVLLSQPGAVSLAGIKEMQQALEMIEKLKTKYAPVDAGQDGPRGISAEALQTIRRDVLRMST